MVAVETGHDNFISEPDAIRIVMQSHWGQSRRAKNEKPRSIFDAIQFGASMQTDSARDARNQMFRKWCSLVLSRFSLEDKETIKEEDGKTTYNEVRLRQWLLNKYEEDVFEEFGRI